MAAAVQGPQVLHGGHRVQPHQHPGRLLGGLLQGHEEPPWVAQGVQVGVQGQASGAHDEHPVADRFDLLEDVGR